MSILLVRRKHRGRGSMPLHAGSVARALLAFEPPAAWEQYAERQRLEAFTPKTPATPEALVAELRATRQRGYAVSDEDVTGPRAQPAGASATTSSRIAPG